MKPAPSKLLTNLNLCPTSLHANETGRDIVIGDLHGELSSLDRLLEVLRFDPSCDRVIAVGDLCDHGTRSIDALALLDRPWFFSVMGNHELMLLDRLNRARRCAGEGDHGLGRFLEAIRAECHGAGGSWQLEWLEASARQSEPASIERKLRTLPFALRIHGCDFTDSVIHAELTPRLERWLMADADDDDRLLSQLDLVHGLTSRIAAAKAKQSGEPILPNDRVAPMPETSGMTLCGHTPMPCAMKDGASIFIDTGNGRRDVAYARLSAFICQERRVVTAFPS
ncbi:metallophosphoesterase [Niveibacterium sp. 24ML]|uniref:metallophosphoesterase n=1 Tax=Niveibacterium sp. 24ML TaxID=2985512 RepID=UPI002270AB31|nr:metallophosphoesterase [Niveibacterium sp. 24ML]MCX9157826.1 metallophosphoesterase [Niveibacterium sp. 24ML]